MQIPLFRLPLLRPSASTKANSSSTKRRWRVRAVAAGVFLLVGIGIVNHFFLGNIHTVLPGRVYRSAQLSPERLHEFIEKNGIRTIINLRGHCPQFDWYRDECRMANEFNISQEDITFSANRLPPTTELHRLIEVFDRTEHPLLLHCRQGADRTGLASAVYLLLYTDLDYATARRQCGARYGHFPILSTLAMDRFFEMYELWLARSELSHAARHFRRWALEEYRPNPAPGRLELLEPTEIAAGEPSMLKVRAFNHSDVAWEFKPGWASGVHVSYLVRNEKAQPVWQQRTGFFRARVEPGESIDIDLALPALHDPGNYWISVELVDRHLSFCQLGSDGLDRMIRVQPKQGR